MYRQHGTVTQAALHKDYDYNQMLQTDIKASFPDFLPMAKRLTARPDSDLTFSSSLELT